jgi:UDP-glucuronate 4-epimerase
MLTNEKILITGPTSQVAFPIARELAKHNEVYGLARFNNPADMNKLAAIKIKCVQADLANGIFNGLPDDISYVLNFAVTKTDNFEYDLAANAAGFGQLMAQFKHVKALLHCSSAAVYQYKFGHQVIKETDPLGNDQNSMFKTYPISKIAAEVMAKYIAVQMRIPTIIIRLNVPYGNNGGWPSYHLDMMKNGIEIPVHTEQPTQYNVIHEDDYISMIPALLNAASVPATIINFGGEVVSIEEWCNYIGQLIDIKPKFIYTDQTLPSVLLDMTLMKKLVGEPKIAWQDGMRRMVEARIQ